jgi:Ala-tRNA(Pro) deacylase
MDKQLLEYLKKFDIEYQEHEHPAFFTVAEAEPYEKNFNFARTKNLFLTDKKGNFFMYCLPADKRAPLNSLKKILKVKDIHFASEKDLFEKLGLKPGSVTIFALIRNPDVKLLLDKEIWDANKIGFHPNVNTATLELTHASFEKFYSSLSNTKEVIEVE